jgi:transmembrane sensor
MSSSHTVRPPAETDDERIRAEARAWALRGGGADDPGLEAAQAAWRAQDPRHEAAFAQAARAWTAVGRTPTARGAAWRREAAALQRSALLKRWAPAAGLAACIAAAGVLVWPQLHGTEGVAYATRTAETRTLDLADGSRVFVAPQTRLEVDVSARRRVVELGQGEAFFEIAHDPAHPFFVRAGRTLVRVVGTKFDVIRTGDKVRVSVLQGRVRVTRRPAIPLVARAAEQTLSGGQQARTGGNVQVALAVSAVGTNEPGAWRSGRLLYADAPLSEVVADANRYSSHPIRLASADIATLRVTATFRTGSVPDLVSNLQQALPLKAQTEPDGTILMSRDPSR